MLTFIIGGARSGKSRRAQQLAEAMPGQLVYIATAQPFDDEMIGRIARHRQDRGERWRTVEAPVGLAAALREQAAPGRAIVVDCLTLWMTNIMLADAAADAAVDAPVDAAVDALVTALAAPPCPVFVVSNEVGLGIVPDNGLARRFRDHAGRLHQRVAEIADRVEVMVAGIALRVK